MVEFNRSVTRLAAIACALAAALLSQTARADAVSSDPSTASDDGAIESTVDLEKSSCLVLSRFDADREISGMHDTSSGQRLQFFVRRVRGGRIVVRVTTSGRTVLSVAVGAGRELVWRIGGIDVLQASTDADARAHLASVLASPEGRALLELAGDLDTLVASAADSRARELSRVVLQGALVESPDAAFGAPPAAVTELRAAVAPR